MITEISIDSIFIDMDNLHDCTFLDEEEVLTLGPCVLESVAEYFSLLKEALVLQVELVGNGKFVRGIIAFVKEEVVVLILVVDAFFKEIVDFLKVCQSINVGNLVLLRIVVYFVVVELMVVAGNSRLKQALALNQQICEHIILSYFSRLHNDIL